MPRSQKTPRPPRTATTQARRLYDTDLTDAQWGILRPLLPPPPGGGRPRTTDLREVLNAILYVLRSGCAWDLLPHDFPPPGTVYGYFSRWRRDGTITRIHEALRPLVRVGCEHEPEPSAASLDSQSVKTRGRRDQGLRRGQEGQGAEASHPGGHAGAADRGGGDGGERAGLPRDQAGVGIGQGSLSAVEGGVGRWDL